MMGCGAGTCILFVWISGTWYNGNTIGDRILLGQENWKRVLWMRGNGREIPMERYWGRNQFVWTAQKWNIKKSIQGWVFSEKKYKRIVACGYGNFVSWSSSFFVSGKNLCGRYSKDILAVGWEKRSGADYSGKDTSWGWYSLWKGSPAADGYLLSKGDLWKAACDR